MAGRLRSGSHGQGDIHLGDCGRSRLKSLEMTCKRLREQILEKIDWIAEDPKKVQLLFWIHLAVAMWRG